MNIKWRRRLFSLAALCIAAVFIPVGLLPASAAPSTVPATDASSSDLQAETPDPAAPAPSVVPEKERDEVLGDGWETSDDLAWTLAGDADGLRILLANRADGYEWRHIATLSRPGVETDRWIGNACLTGDAQWLAVVYAPRSFTNDEALFRAGASAALVPVAGGEIVHLEGGFSLSYFNPGCGRADEIALTQFDGEAKTRISVVSAEAPESPVAYEHEGQLVGAIPNDGAALAISGDSVVRLSANESTETLTTTEGNAFDLNVLPDGAIAYLEHDGERSRAVYHQIVGGQYDEGMELAEGDVTSVGLNVAADGTAVISGSPTTVTDSLPDGFVVTETTAARLLVSSEAELVIEHTNLVSTPSGAAMQPAEASTPVRIDARSRASEEELAFDVPPSGAVATSAAPEDAPSAASEAGGFGMSATVPVLASPTNPVSTGSPCAVPRNDPSIRALQPRPSEVEWYVDKAVINTMNSMFPLPSLNGGGKIPAQVMLGILAQESNFWQASRYSVPGVPGNPLVGNYYGADRFSSAPEAWWQINYPNADCGYGIAQVTDGMETGEMPYTQQLAIATNYQANISRGIQILIEKWNQTRSAGLIINNGDPKYLENWFYALWAYNTGFYPQGTAGQPWGVGWLNNPANKEYPANRTPFLDGSPADAANPQRWPYPEKVLGFAAHSTQFVDSVSSGPLGDTYNNVVAFKPAWWSSSDGHNGVVNRQNVKPPIWQFCDATNSCDITVNGPAGACLHQAGGTYTYQCWYNQPSTWKPNCDSTCGQQYLEYIDDPKPAAATSFPPSCSLPSWLNGAYIVDSVPGSVAPATPGCPSRVPTTGSFQFNFAGNASNNWPSKIDLHQLGSGFNGHFYFSHTRVSNSPAAFNGALDISGTWSLGQALNGWAKVYVHMPSHGAWLQQAEYSVNTGLTTVKRSLNQRNYANEWVPLGAMQFAGTPTVTLTNNSATYSSDVVRDYLSGSDDIAWDAVAILPLDQKPHDLIVSLGDSFSSGEGTSPHNGSGFSRGSDHHGETVVLNGVTRDSPHRNACHRSKDAWPLGIDPPNYPGVQSVRSLAASQSKLLDFHLLACSGAVSGNILSKDDGSGGVQQWAEDTQLDRGFVDANTTLVTLTIGGNNVGFSPVLNRCILSTFTAPPAPAVTYCKDAHEPRLGPGTMEAEVNARLLAIPGQVSTLVQKIRDKAPSARILVLGYPTLFETGSTCVSIADHNRPWLNQLAESLNQKLTQGVYGANVGAEYQSPQHRFSGFNLCTQNSGLNGIILQQTPGEVPNVDFSFLNNEWRLGPSAQSIHPNLIGSEHYATVANETLTRSAYPLASTLNGGAPTTYYSTFRLHAGGTASFNVRQFDVCGQEMRVGLRRQDGSGSFGQQHTNTLSWFTPHKMQAFTWTASSPNTTSLPSGSYAMNARITTACAGGGSNAWQGTLYLR